MDISRSTPVEGSPFPSLRKIQITLTRKRGLVSQEIDADEGNTKESFSLSNKEPRLAPITELFQTGVRSILANNVSAVPFSLAYMQYICESFYMNKDWASEVFDSISKSFADDFMPLARSDLLDGHAFENCIVRFNDWKQRLTRLHEVLISLDESTTLRLPDIKRRRIIPFGLDLFSAAFLDSNKTSNLDVRVADPSENPTRTKILLSMKDSLFREDSHELLLSFQQMVHEIESFQKEFYGFSKLRLNPVFEQAIRQLLIATKEESIRDPTAYMNQASLIHNYLETYKDLFGDSWLSQEQLQSLENILIGEPVITANPHIIEAAYGIPWNMEIAGKLIHLNQSNGVDWLVGLIRKHSLDKYQMYLNQSIENKELVSALFDVYRQLDNNYRSSLQRDGDGFARGIIVDSLEKTPGGPIKLCDLLLKYIETTLGRPRPQDMALLQKLGSGIYDLARIDADNKITTVLSFAPSTRQYFFDKYKIQLSRRLLRGSAFFLNRDLKWEWLQLEKRLIRKFEEMFGEEYTYSLKDMVKGIEKSEEECFGFLELHEASSTNKVDVDLSLVGGESWPRVPDNQPVIIPQQLQPLFGEYEMYFKDAHPSRKMEWKYHFQRIVISVQFDETRPESQLVECSIYQAAIILAFENEKTLSFEQLQKLTGMRSAFLKTNLDSLASSKYQILISDGSYSINESFDNRKKLLRLPILMGGESSAVASSRSSDNRSKDWDSAKIEAYIVTTMKAETTMKHDSLMLKVLEYMKDRKLYDANAVAFVKTIFAKLVNEEYLRREEDDSYVSMLLDLDNDLGDRITEAVLREYERPSKLENKHLAQFRNAIPKNTETTVLASVVGITSSVRNQDTNKRRKHDSSLDVQVMTLCTGMKTVPAARIEYSEGKLVHDSHAEILCLRLFNWMLLKEMKRLKDGGQSDWIQWNQETEKFCLLPNVQFALYVSEIPCGDASLENLADDLPDKTGWKNVEVIDGVIRGRDGVDQLGVVRTKPGRKDSPLSLSKSCSDKLCLKQFTSILNSLTYDLFEQKIFLSYLVLPRDRMHNTALERCFERRIQFSPKVSSFFHPICILSTAKSPSFSGPKSSDLSVLYCPSESFLQVLNKGVRNGCPSKKKIQDGHESVVSRKAMALLALPLLRDNYDSYQDLKDRAGIVTCKRLAREAIGNWGRCNIDNFALSPV
ncbi:hypothetical protein OGAPHI_007288 [Ogataea philodendri]|uniref:A to I editase domain-containing protein n=1 Tax=Ogataea philodendri TaxID=1378263 RepID=A0A9P8NTI8_9ASCO|nr:uncharacterized protein OGAPHI_007288 [Ogataea philodendri]KAH3660083.1 hypothetical protein OGAPHI_007288 [Ogataea philodendri]